MQHPFFSSRMVMAAAGLGVGVAFAYYVARASQRQDEGSEEAAGRPALSWVSSARNIVPVSSMRWRRKRRLWLSSAAPE